MPDRFTNFESRIIRIGLTVLTILGFAAYFIHEVWRIIQSFFSP